MTINTTNVRLDDLAPTVITRAEIDATVKDMLSALNQTGGAATKAGATREGMIRNGITSKAAIEAAIVKAGANAEAGGGVERGTAYERVIAQLVKIINA